MGAGPEPCLLCHHMCKRNFRGAGQSALTLQVRRLGTEPGSRGEASQASSYTSLLHLCLTPWGSG